MREQPLLVVTMWLVPGVLLLAVVTLVVQRHGIRRLRRQIRARDEELRRLVSDRLPAQAQVARGAVLAVPGLVHRELERTEFAALLDAVLHRCGEAEQEARRRVSTAAMAAVRGVTSRIGSELKKVEWALVESEEARPEPRVVEGLWKAGLAAGEARHGVQALQVVCGGWPGQQRRAAPLSEVVRGAASRLHGGERVRMHARVDVRVSGRLVEPLALLIVELLRNALTFSPPSTAVEVDFQQVHHGWRIIIDDAGVGLHPDERHRAELVLSGTRPADLTMVGDPPKLGLAVVASLLRRSESEIGVHVGLTSSAGGMRAAIVVPHEAFITAPPPESPASAVESQAPAPGETVPTTTSSGLPRRTRRRPTAPPEPTKVPAPAVDPRRNASELGAFQRGIQTRGIRADSPSEEGWR